MDTFGFTYPKQEAEEEEEVSDPGIDEGERLGPLQVEFSLHAVLSFPPTFSSPAVVSDPAAISGLFTGSVGVS